MVVELVEEGREAVLRAEERACSGDGARLRRRRSRTRRATRCRPAAARGEAGDRAADRRARLAVHGLLPTRYRLPLLVLDATGMRLGELEGLTWGDVDEQRGRWRVSQAVAKTGRARWVHGAAGAVRGRARLVPRDDRTPERRVFQGFGGDRFRTAITRACTAAGVPAFSPHDLRHRRISLLHLGGVPWARIGEHVGQRNLAVTANTYIARPRRRGRARLRGGAAMKVNRSDRSGAAVELTRDELRVLNGALNEVCNGPEALDDDEMHTRMGVELHDAKALLRDQPVVARSSSTDGRRGQPVGHRARSTDETRPNDQSLQGRLRRTPPGASSSSNENDE